MAIDRGNLGDIAEFAGTVPTGNFTMCTWVNRQSYLETWGAIISIGQESGGFGNQVALITKSDGRFELWHRQTEVADIGASLVVGRWTFCCFYGSLSTSGQIDAYVYDPVLDTEYTVGGTGGTAGAAYSQIYLGSDPADEEFDGLFQYAKCWDRILTLSELRTERNQGAPASHANIWSYWRLLDNTDGLDRSGNGRNMTLTSIDTVAEGPPVPSYSNVFDEDAWIFAAGGGPSSNPKGPMGMALQGVFGGPI